MSFYNNSNRAVLVEINSETDFVAKNADFQKMVYNISKKAVDFANINDLVETDVEGKKITEYVSDHISKIGENINIRRMEVVNGKQTISYIHNPVNKTMGKIGVIVSYEGDDEALAKKIAMHIAASKPLALSEDKLNPNTLDREKNIFLEQAIQSGKPENVLQNIVKGKLKKYFEEVILLKQKFVIDPDFSIEEILSKSSMKILEFARLEVGEGIEKELENFADEVKKTVKS